MISLLGSVLEVIEKLKPSARSVSLWVNYNCLEDILITHFILSVILVALYFILGDQFTKFSYMPLFC